MKITLFNKKNNIKIIIANIIIISMIICTNSSSILANSISNLFNESIKENVEQNYNYIETEDNDTNLYNLYNEELDGMIIINDENSSSNDNKEEETLVRLNDEEIESLNINETIYEEEYEFDEDIIESFIKEDDIYNEEPEFDKENKENDSINDNVEVEDLNSLNNNIYENVEEAEDKIIEIIDDESSILETTESEIIELFDIKTLEDSNTEEETFEILINSNNEIINFETFESNINETENIELKKLASESEILDNIDTEIHEEIKNTIYGVSSKKLKIRLEQSISSSEYNIDLEALSVEEAKAEFQILIDMIPDTHLYRGVTKYNDSNRGNWDSNPSVINRNNISLLPDQIENEFSEIKNATSYEYYYWVIVTFEKNKIKDFCIRTDQRDGYFTNSNYSETEFRYSYNYQGDLIEPVVIATIGSTYKGYTNGYYVYKFSGNPNPNNDLQNVFINWRDKNKDANNYFLSYKVYNIAYDNTKVTFDANNIDFQYPKFSGTTVFKNYERYQIVVPTPLLRDPVNYEYYFTVNGVEVDINEEIKKFQDDPTTSISVIAKARIKPIPEFTINIDNSIIIVENNPSISRISLNSSDDYNYNFKYVDNPSKKFLGFSTNSIVSVKPNEIKNKFDEWKLNPYDITYNTIFRDLGEFKIVVNSTYLDCIGSTSFIEDPKVDTNTITLPNVTAKNGYIFENKYSYTNDGPAINNNELNNLISSWDGTNKTIYALYKKAPAPQPSPGGGGTGGGGSGGGGSSKYEGRTGPGKNTNELVNTINSNITFVYSIPITPLHTSNLNIVKNTAPHIFNSFINYNDDLNVKRYTWSKNTESEWCVYDTLNNTHLKHCFAYLEKNGEFNWYYFDDNSSIHTGWLTLGGYNYYFDNTNDNNKGKMYTGYNIIDGKINLFAYNGIYLNTLN